jgi:hypothetical protein
VHGVGVVEQGRAVEGKAGVEGEPEDEQDQAIA